MLDITHGFRSSPFFAAAVASFVRAVDKNPPDLRICYAAFEARKDGVTPIWDLSEFVSLLDWTSALALFLRTGRSADVAEPTIQLGRELSRRWAETRDGEQPRLRKLGETLRDFGANLETVRTGDLLLPGAPGSAASLSAALQEARQSATAIPPLADVVDRVQREMVEPLLGASDHLAGAAGHRALAGLARLYLEMGRWPEAAAVAREGWITRYSDPSGRAAFGARNPHNRNKPAVEAHPRQAAEGRWRSREGDLSKTIADIRNDIEHAGFNWQPKPADRLQESVRKLVENFAVLPSALEQAKAAGCAPVFVNLSNHPTACWSEAQREAALSLAPEIKDLLFPPVPSEADTDDIDALADELVARLTTESPGATHAMVQGEFTLAHALVRRLQQMGITCLATTTRREIVEQSAGTKTTRFDFVRFRGYT
jgi:CRISPR-associated protein Csx16